MLVINSFSIACGSVSQSRVQIRSIEGVSIAESRWEYGTTSSTGSAGSY